MSTLICPHCGMANRAGANFCNNCGTDLRAKEQPLPENIEPVLETDRPLHDAGPDADSGEDNLEITEDQQVEGVEVEATFAETRAGLDAENEASDSDIDQETGEATGEETVPADQPLLVEQPWLQVEDDESSTTLDDPHASDVRNRTIANLQGLLPPLDFGDLPSLHALAADPADPVATDALHADQAEEVRYLMGETPAPMAAGVLQSRPRRRPGLRIPWVFWLLGLAVALPLFLLVDEPAGAPRQWPGVSEAYATVAALPANASVVAFWAYDPATAGEMDLLAVPVLRHLASRQAALTVVSLLPGGPASARRALATALFGSPEEALLETAERLQLADERLVANLFLPGGVAGLPLIAQAPEVALQDEDALLRQSPQLAVLFAARAEDVQIWLEQVQPINGVAVVAVTSAGADPLLRPYLDSGQLTGLVSGFDGAYAYEELAGLSGTFAPEDAGRIRLAAQNWGQFALLLILVLGNLAGLFGRKERS